VSALRFNTDWDLWEPVTWEGVTNALTAADGTYTLHGLPAGTYKVAFYGPWEGGRAYGARWWRSGTNAQSVDQAGVVTFTATGATSSGKDAVLTEACSVRGAVTDQDGNRATGIKVKLWWNDPVATWAVIQSSYAYHDGDFEMSGFTGGEYRLEFLDDENYLYAPGWYRNVALLADAEEILLTPGESRIIQQTVQATDTNYSPVFGANRILTAISASQLAYADNSVTTVVVATGYNWPDALGGAALAGAYDGPILLTQPTALPWQVADEIARLGATDAIILGGTSAVSGGVESSLKSNLGQYHVRRIGGANRYETANLVAAETVARLGAAYDGTAFVATGLNFPDALGASPLAASASWPIYLTDPSALTPASKAAMLADGVTKPLILGETGAVSPAVESALDSAFGAANVIRLGGATRYETAVKVAQYGVDNVFGMGWNNVAIATGQNYPDALAGGVLQGKTGSVLLLTPTSALDATVAAKLTAKKSVIVGVRYLGGPNAVSEGVRTQVQALLY
jgi:putative cell wall-binding protein